MVMIHVHGYAQNEPRRHVRDSICNWGCPLTLFLLIVYASYPLRHSKRANNGPGVPFRLN